MHAPVKGRELTHDERGAASKKVTLVGAVVNLWLSVLKIAFGWLGHSQSLIADGIHSLSDLASDALVWFAAKEANQAPDEAHPYGHARFETAATFGLGVLLGLVALGVVWEAFERLIYVEDAPTPNQIALYAAAISVVIKEALYWYTVRVAERVNSKMLRANAWHHRTDAISSIVVFIGVAGALFGFTYLDGIAAIAVGLMIGKIGWELGSEAIQELVDKGLEQERVAEIHRLIESIPEVRSLHMLRTRRHAHEASADVHVLVSPWLSVSEGHMIAVKVEDVLKSEIDEINDVTVHVDPEDDEKAPPCKGLPLRSEVEKRIKHLWQDSGCQPGYKRLLLHYLSGKIDIDVVLPLTCYVNEDEAQSLERKFSESLKADSIFGQLKIYYN